MMRPPRLVVMILFAAAPLSFAQESAYLAPQDLRGAVGAAEKSHTPFDIGDLSCVFDGDPRTLARTPSINPLTIEIHFKEPLRAHGIRLIFNKEVHEVLLEAGSKRRRAGRGKTGSEGVFYISFDEPMEVQSWYLSAKRITGDDYVHLYEWEFLEPGEPGLLSITCREHGEFITNIKGDVLPEDLTHPCHIRLRAVLKKEGRPDRDVTGECEWEADQSGMLVPLEEPGRFRSIEPGRGKVIARFMDQEAVFPLMLKLRRLENRALDLDVGFIERFPKHDYDASKGWPASGDATTFQAAVIGWGADEVEHVEYAWSIDGKERKRGVIDRVPPAGGRVRVRLEWTWLPGRHTVTFTIDPEDKVKELTEKNNVVTDFTNALTVGFWVDRQVYDRVHEHLHRKTKEGNSFEDWAQRLIRRWNGIFEEARYPSCPEGVLDRVRLDKVVVVPTDALPLNGGIPTNNPDTRDKTVDLMWGFPTRDLRNGAWDPERDDWWIEDLGVLHELGHARYLVDAYGFDVHAKQILIRDDQGRLITDGDKYMSGDIPHWRKYSGQMGGDYGRLSEYDALCWNWKAGRRAKGSPCNAPPDIGSFLQLMPERNEFRFVDGEGKPFSNASLDVYQAAGNGKDWYGKVFDDTPDIKTTLDKDGVAVFGKELFGGRIVHTFGHSNGVVIFGLRHKGRQAFLFQEVTDLNLKYMQGEHRLARFEKVVPIPDD